MKTSREQFQRFIGVYKEELEKSVRACPDDYAWALSDIDTVLERMTRAIERGSFNKDTPAFRRTCKQLGIKHTYKAINDFITLEVTP